MFSSREKFYTETIPETIQQKRHQGFYDDVNQTVTFFLLAKVYWRVR